MDCHAYENDRIKLKEVFEKYKLNFTLENILGVALKKIYAQLMTFLKETGLLERI